MDQSRDLLQGLTLFSDVALLLMRLLVGFLFIAFLAVSGEFWGGWVVGLGIAPQLGALVIMGVMTGSMYHHIVKWKSPYWAASGGWEYDLMWFTMCLVIVATGGGSIALWRGW